MSQATLNGILTDDGGDPAGCDCTFRYGIDPTADGNGNLVTFTEVDGGVALTTGQNLMAIITGLDPDTIYYFQSVATNSIGTSYGNILTFTTHGIIPILGTPTVSGISRYNATLECSLINDGGEACTLGFMWGADQDNLVNSINAAIGRSPLDFSVDLHSFQPDTTYYFAAFAVNSIGTITSLTVSFHTDTALDKLPILPPPNPINPPPPILPVPPNPLQPVIDFTNIGLTIGGTASAMLLIMPGESGSDKKKKKDSKKDIKQIGNK